MPPVETLRTSCFRVTLVLACRALGTASFPAQPSWDPGVRTPGLCGASGGWGFPTLHRTKEDCDVRSHVVPTSLSPEEQCKPEVEAPLDTGPAEISAPNVYETLQCRLSSLEAVVAAWRHHSESFPRPVEAEDRDLGAPESFGDEEEAARPGQQEAARLTERNAWLRLVLGHRDDELAFTRASLQDAQAEKETLQRQVQELEDSLMQLEASPPPSILRVRHRDSNSCSSGAERRPWAPQTLDSPMAHPLLQRLRSDSSTQSVGCLSTQHPAQEMYLMEDQMGRLQGSIETLKCFNRLLLAVLQGYKGRCESLSIKLGKREAEATALRLALQYSEDCEEVYEVLLALKTASLGTGVGAAKGDLRTAEEEASRLLVEKEAAMDVETPRPSPEGSSVDKPTPEELAAQLHGYAQYLRERWALVKIPEALGPATASKPTMPHAEATVQAILETQPGPALPRLEKSQIQQDLAATRDSLADLVLRLQLAQREKRGLELREAALRALGPAHRLLLQQLRWERAHLAGDGSSGGSSEDPSSEEEAGEDRQQHCQAFPAEPAQFNPGVQCSAEAMAQRGSPVLLGGQMGKAWSSENVSQELSASLARAVDLRAQLQSLRRQLEQVAQKGRTRRAQSAELHRELCKAHSALALAFKAAHRKQEEQRRKLEQQVARMQALQAEELAVLTSTARALGKPGAPQPAQTFL
ncbi:Usher syndrome type-1C protein-binding protein 1 [Apodemus speciosus]|uniref:Usher syndrome type-1C protein-binding protein 1 n=1 Tax=Apodemus speciosus TaxID=105296 RepID=A0ABQ0F289_APOSI